MTKTNATKSLKRINSRDKGQRGEREIIDLLQPIIDCVMSQIPDSSPIVLQRNTLQADRGGELGNADICGLPFLSIEVKNCATLSVAKWWEQCIHCAANAQGKPEPVLFYKAGRGKWAVVVYGRIGYGQNELWTRCEVMLDAWLIWFANRLREWLAIERAA